MESDDYAMFLMQILKLDGTASKIE